MPSAFGVRAMLIGYAIECALKGLWVKKGSTIVRSGRYVRVPGARDHDLVQLARQVGFSASDLEADVLGRMSKFATFAVDTPSRRRPINKVITLISGKKRRAIPRY